MKKLLIIFFLLFFIQFVSADVKGNVYSIGMESESLNGMTTSSALHTANEILTYTTSGLFTGGLYSGKIGVFKILQLAGITPTPVVSGGSTGAIIIITNSSTPINNIDPTQLQYITITASQFKVNESSFIYLKVYAFNSTYIDAGTITVKSVDNVRFNYSITKTSLGQYLIKYTIYDNVNSTTFEMKVTKDNNYIIKNQLVTATLVSISPINKILNIQGITGMSMADFNSFVKRNVVVVFFLTFIILAVILMVVKIAKLKRKYQNSQLR